MLEEDVVLAEVGDSPLAKVGMPTAMKRVAVRKLRDKLKGKVTLQEEGHTNEDEVMAEADEMPISVTGVISGDTSPLNVLKMNKLDIGEHMFLSSIKQRHCHKRWKICLKQGKPWC